VKKIMNRSVRGVLAAAVLGVASVCVMPRTADAGTVNLGAAGQYAVFALDSMSFNGPGTINGNIAVGQSTNFASPAVINGTVFENPGVPAQGNIVPTGGFVKTDLTQAIADAKAAAVTANGLAGTQFFSTLGNNSTLTGTGGVNVIDVGSISLSNGSLTLNGTANDVFIINDAGKFDFSNSGMVLTGGVTASDILFNVGGNVALTGGGNLNFFGTILAPNSDVQVHDKVLSGDLIGNTIEDTSGFTVNGAVVAVPLPAAAWNGMATLGLLGIGAKLWGRKSSRIA